MSEIKPAIKTAEERMQEYGKYGDHLEIVSFHKQEIAELRAALEALNGKCHELKAKSEIDARTIEAQEKRIAELESKKPKRHTLTEKN